MNYNRVLSVGILSGKRKICARTEIASAARKKYNNSERVRREIKRLKMTGRKGMNYEIPYICVSHIGRRRNMNQDNFICDGRYFKFVTDPDGSVSADEALAAAFAAYDAAAGREKEPTDAEPLVITGCLTSDRPALLGIFDGVGGAEHGEAASLLAAEEASEVSLSGDAEEELLSLCGRANARICRFADRNGIMSTGTTAAVMAFAQEEMALCNIGDSKIFRYSDREAEQLSVDHVCAAPYGLKAPLSQCLGIPPTEMLIRPYSTKLDYRAGDMYLICSDGLTDMVPLEEITGVLADVDEVISGGRRRRAARRASCRGRASDVENVLEASALYLLDQALEYGGRDNITLILCRITPVNVN